MEIPWARKTWPSNVAQFLRTKFNHLHELLSSFVSLNICTDSEVLPLKSMDQETANLFIEVMQMVQEDLQNARTEMRDDIGAKFPNSPIMYFSNTTSRRIVACTLLGLMQKGDILSQILKNGDLDAVQALISYFRYTFSTNYTIRVDMPNVNKLTQNYPPNIHISKEPPEHNALEIVYSFTDHYKSACFERPDTILGRMYGAFVKTFGAPICSQLTWPTKKFIGAVQDSILIESESYKFHGGAIMFINPCGEKQVSEIATALKTVPENMHVILRDLPGGLGYERFLVLRYALSLSRKSAVYLWSPEHSEEFIKFVKSRNPQNENYAEDLTKYRRGIKNGKPFDFEFMY